MKDKDKTKEQLIDELKELRQRISELEKSEVERKKVEEKLRESEGQFKNIVELSTDGYLCADLKGRITDCNSAFLSHTGYTRKDFVNKHFTKLPTVRVKDIPQYIKMFNAAIRGKTPKSIEYKWIHKDRTTRWGEGHFGIVKKKGKISGFHITTKDITESKRAEEALREGEEKFRILTESSFVGIFIFQDSIFKYVNPAVAEIFGYKTDELIYKMGPFELTIPDDHKASEEYIKKCFAGQTELPFLSFRGLTKSGKVINCEVLARCIEFKEKPAVMGTLIDITERKKAEEALKENEERLRIMFESIEDGIVVTDVEANIIKVNNAILRMGGYSHKEEFIGRNAIDFVSPNDRAKAMENLSKELEAGNSKGNIEYALLAKDGSEFYVESNATVLHDSSGNHVGLINVIRDITERKKVEEELRTAHENLQKLTEHLQKVREDERKSVAREIHDDVGQNLAALKMDMHMIEKKLPKEQKPLIDRMKKMMELTDKTVQTVRKIHEELRPSLLDGVGLVEAIELYKKEFEDKIEVKCELHIEPESIDLSKERSLVLFRILQESMTNVRLHSGATKMSVSIREKNGKLELKVKDNGVGITEEQLTKSRSFGVMGIRERVDFLGGKMKIKGIPDKGTTLKVTIPLKTVNEDQS